MVGRRIIVADDSRTVQKVIRLVLVPSGYDVECFDNGKEALQAATDEIPLMVLADVSMPDLNAYSMGVEMKKTPALKNVPLIVLYGGFDEINMSLYKDSGAKEKLAKPFDAKQLLDVVRKYSLVFKDEEKEIISERNLKEQKWDMDEFEAPDVPDLKSPLNEKIQEENDGNNVLFRLEENDPDENIGIPEPSELSEEESRELLNEYKLKENDDGTIKFDDTGISDPHDLEEAEPFIEEPQSLELLEIHQEEQETESNENLWSERFYSELTEPVKTSEPLINLAGEDTEKEIEPGTELNSEALSNNIDVPVNDKLLREIIEKQAIKMLKDILPDIAERLVKAEIDRIVNDE